MLKSQMQRDQQSGFYEWLNAEWYRCDAHRATMENHAVTYLMTVNGGGAAAVIAFAGSAGYATRPVYLTLGLFLLGLFFTGCGIAIGMQRLSRITRDLGDDHLAFNDDKIRSQELEERHRLRFQKRGLGNFLGWIAWFCFIVGIISSAYTFSNFMAAKRLKTMQETSSVAVELPEQPSLIQHSVPKEHIQDLRKSGSLQTTAR